MPNWVEASSGDCYRQQRKWSFLAADFWGYYFFGGGEGFHQVNQVHIACFFLGK